jgi:pyruvate,water dikinase
MEASGRRREQAVHQVLDALAGQEEEQQNLRDAIEGFQACAAAREDAAFYFQHPWALIRQSVLELGRRLVAAGTLEDVEQVFFLDKKELAGVLAAMDRGETPPTLGDVATGRKSTWEHQRKLAAPDRIPIDFVVDGLDETPQLVRDEQGTRIIGKPASPGRGKGRARIVRSPDELSRFVRGDILVTNAASPAFTPLLLVAAGLVTEAGGGATHSSLLARELGVPAVVDAGNATHVIRDGQMVEVDGTRGVVTLLE